MGVAGLPQYRPAPSVISLAPVSGAGQQVRLTGTFSHADGPSQLYLAYILVLPTPNVVNFVAKGSCLIEYNRVSNGVRLIDDVGTGWIGPPEGVRIEPAAAALTNRACSVDVAGVKPDVAGGMLRVTAPITFRSGLAGVLATFLQAQDMSGQWTGMTQFGNWLLPVSVTPPTGPRIDGVTFTPSHARFGQLSVSASHTAGWSNLTAIHVSIGPSITSTTRCQFLYVPSAQRFYLIDSALAVLVNPQGTMPGLGTDLTNGRCTLHPPQMTAKHTGNTVTLSAPVFWDAAEVPARYVYIVAFDASGGVTHWVAGGFWAGE
jgi:hypothetical protein